jgi:hypothetical protein
MMHTCCHGCVALEAGELDRVESIIVISRGVKWACTYKEIVISNFLDAKINVTSTIVS